jgi:signal transduction histidine kinase
MAPLDSPRDRANDGSFGPSDAPPEPTKAAAPSRRIAAALILVIAVNLMSFWCIWGLLQLTRWRTDVRRVQLQMEVVLSLLKDAETGQRGYLLTEDEEYLKPYLIAQTRLDPAIVELSRLQTSWDSKIDTDYLRKLSQEKLEELRETVDLVRAGKKDAAFAVIKGGRGRQSMDQIRSIIGQAGNGIEGVLRGADDNVQRGANFSLTVLAFGGTCSLLLLWWSFRILRREIVRRRVAEEMVHDKNADLLFKNQKLKEANDELEAFSYSISHDLRAPLRHIHGFASILKKSSPLSTDAQSASHLQIILDSAHRLGLLIDKLLAFSRISRVALQESVVNLNEVAREARKEAETDRGDRIIDWKIGELPGVRGDTVLLRQVLVNLFSNAVKFTRKRDRAEISAGYDAVEHRFFVRDNGVGFDNAHKSQLFGVFQRLHNEKEFEGTGIGLANVKRIIERHGGKIWAEGTAGAGAIFYFTLPLESERKGKE